MYGADFFNFSFWWVFPLVMILLCFFMMRGCRGSMMCWPGPWGGGRDRARKRDSAKHILEQRYARGEIDLREYEEKREVLDGD